MPQIGAEVGKLVGWWATMGSKKHFYYVKVI